MPHFCSSASATGKSPFAIFAADVYLWGGEPSPGADVGGVSRVPVQMWLPVPHARGRKRLHKQVRAHACSGGVQWVRAVGGGCGSEETDHLVVLLGQLADPLLRKPTSRSMRHKPEGKQQTQQQPPPAPTADPAPV